MVYTEIKEKNGKKYYYRVLSVREGQSVGKRREYLGANLKKNEIKSLEEQADKQLGLLSNLLTKEEIKELEKIKNNYLSLHKKTKENRYESFISLFTFDSTNIEGNTLTLQETSQLLFEQITPRKSLREINEILNHKKAFDYMIKENKKISKELILKLHELITQNTLKPELNNQIGKYRTLQVYIRGTNWLPPKPQQVTKEMGSLLSWYSKNKDKLHPLILAAYFHSGFETIHPFVDGNGRVGRLLMNLILNQNKFPMINIPNNQKYLYYEALEESQIKGNLRPLIELLIDLLKKNKVMF
jgi:Fic family protein